MSETDRIQAKLDVLQEVLDVLNAGAYYCGQVICAGGAARDVFHGKEPKDFDLCVLHGNADTEPYDDLAELAVSTVARALPEATITGCYESYRTRGSQSIAYVVKFTFKGVDFDLIEYRECMPDPRTQVEHYDCTLNMVWFTEDAAQEDGNNLVVVTHPKFREVVTGAAPVRHTTFIDGDVNKRLQYLQEKYPQYTYNFIKDEQCSLL